MDNRYQTALKRMLELGWSDAAKLLKKFSLVGFAKLLKQYQKMHGIKADGKLGPVTERSLDALRVCGLPEQMNVGRNCKWPKSKVTYALVGSLPGITAATKRDAFAEAWARWSRVAKITAEYTANDRTADIIIGTGHIDGPNGTLAWSELPCGNPRQLTQKYDTGEPWGIFDNGGRGRIDLVRVACHEIGHVIGIPHIGSGNLMAPTYSPTVNAPQRGDITEAVARYGKPQVMPEQPPTPTVPPTDNTLKTILIRGEIVSATGMRRG